MENKTFYKLYVGNDLCRDDKIEVLSVRLPLAFATFSSFSAISWTSGVTSRSDMPTFKKFKHKI